MEERPQQSGLIDGSSRGSVLVLLLELLPRLRFHVVQQPDGRLDVELLADLLADDLAHGPAARTGLLFFEQVVNASLPRQGGGNPALVFDFYQKDGSLAHSVRREPAGR